MTESPADMESSLIAHLDACDPKQWIALLNWAAPEMIRKGQHRLLAELCCREAQRRNTRWPQSSNRLPSDEIASVLSDIGLQLALKTT